MLDVMVVDDSPSIRAAIGLILSHAGHRVCDVPSGAASLAALQEGAVHPDLFILDLNMPGMDGIELLRRIREMQHYRFTPVLFLTTEGNGEFRKRAKAAGASGWLVKPIAAEDLVRVLKRVCPKAS
jgi:two-component system chemotaxis response regulator CheY